jgi:hypothetical protein
MTATVSHETNNMISIDTAASHDSSHTPHNRVPKTFMSRLVAAVDTP